MRLLSLAGIALLSSTLAGAPGDPYAIATWCTAYPVNIGRRITVSTGAELQQALDGALGGDTIVLTPGTTYRPAGDSFVLRNRPIASGQWVLVRSASSTFDPRGSRAPGIRIEPGDSAQMPLLRTSRNDAPVIRAEAGAHGYRLVGLDIAADAALRQVTNLVELGSGGESSVAAEPSDILIDRSYLHGNDSGNFRRGVALNGARMGVVDSYLANFRDANGDSQAIAGWNGPGPFKIVNNFLEAASENILIGGADPAIPNLVPSDIEIRRNLSTKRLDWQSARVPVKNAFELKNARRVLVEGNRFEHVWVSGQDGTAIVLKSANQDGGCPWCVTEYVTFRNNTVSGAANGLLINAAETGSRGQPRPVRANHIRVDNVLFEDIGGTQWGSEGGILLRVFGGVADASLTHITSRGNRTMILQPQDTADSNPRLVFKYNIVERKLYGIGTGSDEGTRTLDRNFSPYTYAQNVIVNTSAGTDQAIADGTLESRYPKSTWIARDWNDVGFQPGSSKLGPSSRYAGAGDDGKSIGADVDAIAAAQSGRGRTSDGCGGEAVPRPGR